MTQLAEPRGVDSDRVDGGRRPWRPVLTCVVIGLLIGGLIGGLYGARKVATHQATTALSVNPDSSVNTQLAQNNQNIDATSFIQSQLVVLNGSPLAASVEQQLGLKSSPTLSSTQVGSSYVVQVQATAGSSSDAVRIATAAADIYARQRSQQLAAGINASVASITAQLTTVQANLAAAQAGRPANSGLTPSETALQTEYQRLLGVNSALSLALPQVDRVVTVLSPASASGASLSATTKDLIGGAAIGALLGLVALLIVRRTIARIRTVGDVSALGVQVMLPVVTRRRAFTNPNSWSSSSGRLLAARLAGQAQSPREPLIVVGATAGVGTSFAAATVAAGLAERGPVLLVLAAEAVNGSHGRVVQPAPTDRDRPQPTQGDPDSVADLIALAVPSVIPGVWLMPCGDEFEQLRDAAPWARSEILSDVLTRASAAGWLVVFDAPAMNESDLALDCAGDHSIIALVVGRDLSRPADVLSAAELFDSYGSRFAGVILNDVPRRFMRRRRPIAPPYLTAPAGPTSGGAMDTSRSSRSRRSTGKSRAEAPTSLSRRGSRRRRAAASSRRSIRQLASQQTDVNRNHKHTAGLRNTDHTATDVVPLPPDIGRRR
ncbi:MAG: Chromosome partitioning ATPase, Mrp family, contains Fe-S cluster [Pseudonocardiales bacterium]|nr:Chromosome partitioning ATPase, Mrp family, contains Fe-S cluster [Pseudonocardiales bacterium]